MHVWGRWRTQVVNDPFKLLAARQAAELGGGSETDSDYSDSDTSSSEASDDWSDSEDDDADSGGEGDIYAGGSDDNDGETEDDDLLRQRRRANNFDGDDESMIPGRSMQKKRHPLPSKSQSRVALILRDMNNKLKDQLSRRRLLSVGTSLTALHEVDGRTEKQGSSDRYDACEVGLKEVAGRNSACPIAQRIIASSTAVEVCFALDIRAWRKPFHIVLAMK